MVKVRGIEPRIEASKAPVLPLYYTKLWRRRHLGSLRQFIPHISLSTLHLECNRAILRIYPMGFQPTTVRRGVTIKAHNVSATRRAGVYPVQPVDD